MLICDKSRGNLGRDKSYATSLLYEQLDCVCLKFFAQFISFKGRDISNFYAWLEDYADNYCMSNSP